jgi:hypothetical protein
MTEAELPARGSPVASRAWLTDASRAAGPPLLFGLRLWASVCLAPYVAFWLELDNVYWAGTSAAVVCQPHLGASLRNGWYRMIGTVVGAVAIVVLTACFPQDRALFLMGLALWGAACALVATLLRNFASYSAALAGYTVAIIASDQLGATGGPNGQAFMLGVTAPARSASASSAPASFSRAPIWAAPDAAWPRCSLHFRPRSRADLLPLCASRGANSRRHNRFGASSSALSPPSTRSSTRRSASPPSSATIRRYCKWRWTACSPPQPAGVR